MNHLLLSFTAAIFLTGCAASHISSYKPKKRDYNFESSTAKDEVQGQGGSLWKDKGSAALLFSDARALRENDLVVVKIEEVANAKRSADTELTRDSKLSADINAFLRTVNNPAGPPLVDGKFGANSSTEFQGHGTTGRSERLTATVPAIVRKVLPNGNLFIEGHRVILVNSEEHHFYISGVVRPIDIDQENSLKSSMIADAEIEFTGRGVVTDNQQQGLLARFLGWIWPF